MSFYFKANFDDGSKRVSSHLTSEPEGSQFGNCVKPVCIEFFVRYLSADMNDLVQFKLKSELDKQREIEIKLSTAFLKLADLVGKSFLDIYRECVLTGFSLNPTNETLSKIKALAASSQNDLSPNAEESKILTSDKAENDSNTDALYNITNDNTQNDLDLIDENIRPDKHGTVICSTSNTHFAKNLPENSGTSVIRYFGGISNQDSNVIVESSSDEPNLKSNGTELSCVQSSTTQLHSESCDIKSSIHGVYASNFEKEAVVLGLSRHLMDDLSTVLRSPRYQSLNWDYHRDKFEYICENYLNDFSKFKDTTNKELKYLKIDYNQFKDWPQELDKDRSSGIEKGYEKWVDGSEESNEPFLGSASCSQSIGDTESSDSFSQKKPLKRKEINRHRSDSDSEFEIGRKKSKKKRRKIQKTVAKVNTDSDNGTLDSIKSMNVLVERKSAKKKKVRSKKTLRTKTLMRNTKIMVSSQTENVKSNDSEVRYSNKFSDKISSDNENDNNSICNKAQDVEKHENENVSTNVNANSNKPKDSAILKTLRTFRKHNPKKIGFSFFTNLSPDEIQRDFSIKNYSSTPALSTTNSNNLSLSNKIELSNGVNNYFSEKCKFAFSEDEPLALSPKIKSFSKIEKNGRIKPENFDNSLKENKLIQNTVSDLTSLENFVEPSQTETTVQVVQVTNHSAITSSSNSTSQVRQTSSDKPLTQSTPVQNSSTQRNVNANMNHSQSGCIKNQNSCSPETQSSSQNTVNNSVAQNSTFQYTPQSIVLQHAANPVTTQSALKVQTQTTQSTLIVQNQSGEQKQLSNSNSSPNNIKTPPRSAFVLVSTGDASGTGTFNSSIAQQQIQQAFFNLTNSSGSPNNDRNTATLFKAEDVSKSDNIVQLTVSRDHPPSLVTQEGANKRNESTQNIVISQPANFSNARVVETKESSSDVLKVNTTTLKPDNSTEVIKPKPISQASQNASLPKFQQAFGKTMYQSVSCPVISENTSESKVINALGFNQVQVSRDSSSLLQCSVVSKGVQTIKESGGLSQKIEPGESTQAPAKDDSSSSPVVSQASAQIVPQIRPTQVKTSSISASPGVIFTCKSLAVIKKPDGSGDSMTIKKPDAKILKDPIKLNELLTAALQANIPIQTSSGSSNVINIVNPLNQTIQISSNSEDKNKTDVSSTGSQRITIPSIIQKTIARQTVVHQSALKVKPLQSVDIQTAAAVLKLPVSIRSAFLSSLANLNQSAITSSASTPPAASPNRTGSRNHMDPNSSMESSTTMEQVREFESVLEHVTKTSQMKERINIQLHPIHDTSTVSSESNSTEFSSIASSQSNSAITPSSSALELQSEKVLSFVSQSTSSEVVTQKLSSSAPVVVVQRRQTASPALSITSQSSSSPIPCSSGKSQKSVKPTKPKVVKTPPVTSPLKVATTIPKPQQKPQEDEQTTQRIYAILDKYAEQLRNSPELKNKPAPRRRSNPPTNPSQSSKRKKNAQTRSRCNSQQTSCSLGLDMSPGSEDVRTMGSEDSSNGVSQLSQVTSSPQSRIDDTPATPSSETSESLDARDTRTQAQPQTQSGVANRAVIVSDSLLNSESTKIPTAQPRQPTVVTNATSVAGLQPGTIRLLVQKGGPKMYRIQQMVPGSIVFRPGLAKISGGMASQNVGSLSGQQTVVLPTGARSFAFTDTNSDQTINLDNSVVSSGINLLQLQTSESTNTNISTLVTASTALSNLSTSLVENNRLSVTSNNSTVCQLSSGQSSSTNSSQLLTLTDASKKEKSVWNDFNTIGENKPLFLELRKSKKSLKTSEPSNFTSCENDLKLELSNSSSPSLMKPNSLILDSSLDVEEEKDESKACTLAVDVGIKKGKPVKDTQDSPCDETVSWQQYCLTKIDSSQEEKSFQTINQSISDPESCSGTSTLALSHTKRKLGISDNTLFQSTFRRSDRLQMSKHIHSSQQKKAELKSLSEECKDLGVDKPSASDLFPEAELLLDLDPSSQEAEIQLLTDQDCSNKLSGFSFLQADSPTNTKAYTRSCAKSKVKLSSSSSSPVLKLCSDSDSPVLEQCEVYCLPLEKSRLKSSSTSVLISTNVDSPQSSTFGSQTKPYNQSGSQKRKSNCNETSESLKSRKRVLTRSHRPSSHSKTEKRKILSTNLEPRLLLENSVNGGFDLDSDSVDFKKTLGNLTEDDDKLQENSLDDDYSSLATPTQSSSDTIFSDPHLNMFVNTNNLYTCSSSQNNYRSRSRGKCNQDNQETGSFWSMLKKSDPVDDPDSDIEKTMTTSDLEDPMSENELALSSNGIGRKSISSLKTTKSKMIRVKEDLDVASCASSMEISEGDKLRASRRSSVRGLVKKPCPCYNGSPEQPKRKNPSHISSSSCSSSTSKKSQNSKGQSLLKSVLKKR